MLETDRKQEGTRGNETYFTAAWVASGSGAASSWDVFTLPAVEEQSSKAAPAGTAVGPWGMPGTCSLGLGVMGKLQSPGRMSS